MCHCLKRVQCLDVDSFLFPFITNLLSVDSNSLLIKGSVHQNDKIIVWSLNPRVLYRAVQVLRYLPQTSARNKLENKVLQFTDLEAGQRRVLG